MVSHAEGTFGSVLASSGDITVGLAAEALRKVSGSVEDFTGMNLKVFEQAFIQQAVHHHNDVSVNVECGVSFPFH